MMRRKLLAAVAVTAAALVAMPQAHAADAGDTYEAQATASVLRVNLFGQGFTVGSAAATADSTPKATAEGRGAVVSTQTFGATDASATQVGQTSGSDTPVCSEL